MINAKAVRRDDILSAELLNGIEKRIRSLVPDKARFAPRGLLYGETVPFHITVCSSEIHVGSGWAYYPESLDFSESWKTDGYETDYETVSTTQREVGSYARTSRKEFEARDIAFADANKGTVYVYLPLTRRYAEVGWGASEAFRQDRTRSEDGNYETSSVFRVYAKRAAWLVPAGEITASRAVPDRANSATIAVLQDGGLQFHLRNNIFLFDFDVALETPAEILDSTYTRTVHA